MQTVYFAEIVDMLINNRDCIKSLKREKTILTNEVAMIGQKLCEIEEDFNSCSIEFDNKLGNNLLNYYSKLDNIEDIESIESTESTELKKLAKLAKKYKKLARLFKKYTKQLVEIDLELISYASIKENKSLEIPVNTNNSYF